MFSASRPPGLSLSLAASAGAHGLLLVFAAALMMVLPPLQNLETAGERKAPPASGASEEATDDSFFSEIEEEEEEPEVAVSFLDLDLLPQQAVPELPPETKAVPPRTANKRLVIAPARHAVRDPQQEDTPFISSQNMRAASYSEAVPGADPRVGNRDGLEDRGSSLANSTFSEGSEPQPAPSPARVPQETTTAAVTPPEPVAEPAPPLQSAPPPEAGQRPPEPQVTVKTNDPLAPAPGDSRPDRPPSAETAGKAEEKVPENTAKEPRLREAVLKPLAAATQKPKPRTVPLDPVQSSHQSDARPRTTSSVRTKAAGGATEKGQESVDALDTPEGRYFKAVHDVINPLWNRKLSTVRGLTGTGVVEVSFEIDARGKISNVRLVDPGKANPVLEDVCLTSIISARLPRPPAVFQEELRDPLSNGRIRHTISFYKY